MGYPPLRKATVSNTTSMVRASPATKRSSCPAAAVSKAPACPDTARKRKRNREKAVERKAPPWGIGGGPKIPKSHRRYNAERPDGPFPKPQEITQFTGLHYFIIPRKRADANLDSPIPDVYNRCSGLGRLCARP